MKKLVAAIFALSLLGAGTADAASVGIGIYGPGYSFHYGGGHYRRYYPRHRVRVCWRYGYYDQYRRCGWEWR